MDVPRRLVDLRRSLLQKACFPTSFAAWLSPRRISSHFHHKLRTQQTLLGMLADEYWPVTHLGTAHFLTNWVRPLRQENFTAKRTVLASKVAGESAAYHVFCLPQATWWLAHSGHAAWRPGNWPIMGLLQKRRALVMPNQTLRHYDTHHRSRRQSNSDLPAPVSASDNVKSSIHLNLSIGDEC